MDSALEYAIVKFPNEENSPRAVIPLCWVDEEKKECMYPMACSYEKQTKLVKNKVSPGSDWASCAVSIMRKYSSYAAARLDLPRSENTSNLESEEEEGTRKRKRIENARYKSFPGEEDEDEDPIMKEKTKKIPFPKLKTFSNIDSFHTTSLPSSVASSSCSSSSLSQSPRPFLGGEIQNVLTVEVENGLFSPKSSRCLFSPQQNISNEKLYHSLLQLQGTVNSMHDIMLSMQDKINSLSNKTEPVAESDDSELDLLRMLPILTLEDLLVLESKIKETPLLRKKFVKIITAVGGRDGKSMTLNIMKRLVGDVLATKLSYTGKKGFKEDKTISFGDKEI